MLHFDLSLGTWQLSQYLEISEVCIHYLIILPGQQYLVHNF